MVRVKVAGESGFIGPIRPVEGEPGFIGPVRSGFEGEEING